jgi:hypothetical protein
LTTALVDGHRLVVGTKRHVLTALNQARRNKGAVIRKAELLKAITTIDKETSIALIGSTAALQQGLGVSVNYPTTAKLFEKMASMRLDVRFTTDVKGALVLQAKDADAAKELKPEVNKLLGQVKQMIELLTTLEPKAKPLGELTRNLKIKVKGRSLVAEVSLSGEAVEALVKLATQDGGAPPGQR